MTPHRRAALSFASLLPAAACSPFGLANALTPRQGIVLEEGVGYGPLPRHRLDLHAPAGLPAEAPLLVFFYGGGWTAGARADYAFAARPLARLGCLVAVPDYRLWPEVAWPGFVEDGALAVRSLARDHPGRRLVLMGHSAGAFIAASLALDPRWGVRHLGRGFVGLAGPYDFRAEEASPPAIFARAPRAMAAPPEVDLRGAPPLLLLHGSADRTVGPYHSRILAERATQAGVPVRHVVLPEVGHVGILAAVAAPVRGLGLAGGDVLGEVARFMQGPSLPVT